MINRFGIKNNYHIYVVRHGESIWNLDSKFTGWTDIPLTKNGEKEAKKIGETLRKNNINPTIIFSSSLKRSIDTANIIKDGFRKLTGPYTSWRLNERHYGTLEGIPRQTIRDEYGDKFTKMIRCSYYMTPPIIDLSQSEIDKYPIFKNCYYNSIRLGESKEHVLKRLLPYFENDIMYKLTEKHVPLIVTHKHCIRVLIKYLTKMNEISFEKYELPNNSIIKLTFDDNMIFQDYTAIRY
jgi:2,3-bisphosphoglycerate-dependent phosphoglycerate mutase|tara:strand:- start:132 stop:845 length:714 start_codon:yes stop_codon:yes gene_type:complete